MKNVIAELTARVGPSIVGVVSPTNRGSGYCALPNGLVVTSLDVVGYDREVQLVLEDGSAVAALVVRANVALDVALLLPKEPTNVPSLTSGSDPTLGEEVVVFGRAGAEPLATQTRIVSTNRVYEQFGHVQLDADPEAFLLGAPVLDAGGGVIGLVVRPRRVRTLGDRNAHRWAAGLVLPISSFEGGLLSADGPHEEVRELMPEYGCPRCDTIFEPDLDRCLECGTRLPHRFLREGPVASTPPSHKGAVAGKAALASLGIPGNRAQVAPRTWRFAPAMEDQLEGSQLDLTTDEDGDHLILRSPVVRLPVEGFESLYRHLLTLNDESAGEYRFSVVDSAVYMSLFIPARLVDPASFPTRVSDFARTLTLYRGAFQRHFGVDALFENEVDS
jgi:hypothetical protein